METDVFKYLRHSFRVFSIVFIFVLIFIFSPYFSDLDFKESGPFGDTLAGLAAVFFGGLSVIFTFLAFWSQFQANQLQASRFQRQNEDSISLFLRGVSGTGLMLAVIGSGQFNHLTGDTLLTKISHGDK